MDINGLLQRNIKPGSQYEGLIPKYIGIQHDFEKTPTSDTYDTLKFMALWVEKYHHQMSRIAPKLKGATLEKTVKNIYEFLYWHFQYKLDENLQQLYSPSAAWHFRKIGFDCKTFSLLASCILTELRIPHSFRKVQQPGIMPGEWSHVYIIVHDKQKYHVIDATTHTNTEVYFSKKYDFMLKHRGLAGSYSAAMPGKPAFNGLGNNKVATFNGLGCGPNTNCGCGSLNAGLKASVSWNDVKGMFTSFECLGSAAYSQDALNKNVQDFNTLFSGIMNDVNAAKNSRNMNQLAISVARFQATANLIVRTYTQKRDEKDWRNACTVKRFNATIEVGKFYVTAATALQGWMQTYFNVGSVANTMTISNEGWEVVGKYWGMFVLPYVIVNQPVYNLTEKQTAPNFEITKYVLDASKTNSFNLSAFLQTLSSVANVVDGGSNNTGGSSNSGGINPDGTFAPITGNNTSSGISPTAMGVGAVGIIGAILFWPSIKKAVFSNSNSK